MPYTVTEYDGVRSRVLAIFFNADDAISYVMHETVERIPTDPEDLVTLYQGTRSDDDATPWLVVEASAQCPMCGSSDTFDDNGTRECRQCGSRWFRTPPSEVTP